MKKIFFKNKEEWVKYRCNGIGGSDASSIIGSNPYKDNIKLWGQKTGRVEIEDISDKPFVKYGVNAESPLRELFKLDYPQYDVTHDDNAMIIDEEYPFLFASLDGELVDKQTEEKGFLEIKTTNILNSTHKEKWNDKIPQNYYIQCLHYFIVTKYDFGILKAHLKSEFNNNIYITTKHYKIDRCDVLDDIEYLKQAEIKFWNENILKDKKPNLILPEI